MEKSHPHKTVEFQEFANSPEVQLIHLQSVLEGITGRPAFIHVSGASGSGKSTFSRLLSRIVEGSQTIEIDNYFIERLWDQNIIFNHDSGDPNRPYIAGLDPKIWDFDLLERHMEALKTNESIDMPIFDQTIKDRAGYTKVKPSKAIILEGGNSFSERFLKFADYKIYIDAQLHDRLIRKMVRTQRTYGRDDIDDTLTRYFTKDEPARAAYYEEHTSEADQVFYNPCNPAVEFAGFAALEVNSQGERIDLKPREGVGALSELEWLGIIDDGFNQKIQYAIDGRLLVSSEIGECAVSLMTNYYEAS